MSLEVKPLKIVLVYGKPSFSFLSAIMALWVLCFACCTPIGGRVPRLASIRWQPCRHRAMADMIKACFCRWNKAPNHAAYIKAYPHPDTQPKLTRIDFFVWGQRRVLLASGRLGEGSLTCALPPLLNYYTSFLLLPDSEWGSTDTITATFVG